MALIQKSCDHLDQLNTDQLKTAQHYHCDECIKENGSWVHLRTCQTCGVTLCCDSSPGQHATKHFQSHGHPIIISAEPGERWAWCYEDKLIKKY